MGSPRVSARGRGHDGASSDLGEQSGDRQDDAD